MYKQIIAVRTDLKMSKGKLAAQVAHAAIQAYKNAEKDEKDAWEREGSKKIVLGVSGLKELEELKKKAGQAGLPMALVRDAGRTELPPGTVTCLGVGPAKEGKIDKLAGELKTI